MEKPVLDGAPVEDAKEKKAWWVHGRRLVELPRKDLQWFRIYAVLYSIIAVGLVILSFSTLEGALALPEGRERTYLLSISVMGLAIGLAVLQRPILVVVKDEEVRDDV